MPYLYDIVETVMLYKYKLYKYHIYSIIHVVEICVHKYPILSVSLKNNDKCRLQSAALLSSAEADVDFYPNSIQYWMSQWKFGREEIIMAPC